MDDPWKFIAFPAAAIAGFLVSLAATTPVQSIVGLNEFSSQMVVIAATGLVAGFLVDEVIPTYIQHIRSSGGGGGGDMDMGGGDDDFSFD